MINIDLESEWIIHKYPPARTSDIKMVEAELSTIIPDVYKKVLSISNGVVGNLFSLYGTDNLVEMNITYEVQIYAPGYVAIGNDNGGYHLLMKSETQELNFQLVDNGDGIPKKSDCIGNLVDLLHSMDGNPWGNRKENISDLQKVRLLLIKMPDGGTKSLVKLKSVLRLQDTIGELYKRTNTLPCVLLENIPLQKAKALIKNWGDNSIFDVVE